MSRIEPSAFISNDTLDELIPMYVANKTELDSYDKICKDENAKIKQLMLDVEVAEYSAGGYTAKRIVTEKETINEERLMVILKKHNIPNVIKTKEYVDMDELENYLYNNEVTGDFAYDLSSCKSTKEIVQLRVSKEKKKKGDEE